MYGSCISPRLASNWKSLIRDSHHLLAFRLHNVLSYCSPVQNLVQLLPFMPTLPSFQEFCQQVGQESPAGPPPSRTVSSPTSPRNATNLTISPCTPTLRLDQILNHVSPIQDDGLSRFEFNEDATRIMQKLEQLVELMGLDNAFSHLFLRDPERLLYGADSAMKPSSASLEPSGLSEKKQRKWKSDKQHGLNEKYRRDRHRVLQNLLHSLTCEMANKEAEQDAVFMKVNTARTSAKLPGKDDQFKATVYQLVLMFIIVGKEHEGRKATESRCLEVVAENTKLKKILKRKMEDDGVAETVRLSPTKRLAVRHSHESSTSSWSQQSSRFPPSPSPSPSPSSSTAPKTEHTFTTTSPKQVQALT